MYKIEFLEDFGIYKKGQMLEAMSTLIKGLGDRVFNIFDLRRNKIIIF